MVTSLPEPPPHVLDEDEQDRRQVRRMLALSPEERLLTLTSAYELRRYRLFHPERKPREQGF